MATSKEDLIIKQLDALDSKFETLNNYIVGNGTPGLKVEVDRLKQAHARTSRFQWLVMTVFAGTGGAWLFARLFG